MTTQIHYPPGTSNRSIIAAPIVSKPNHVEQVSERIKFLLTEYLQEERDDFTEPIEDDMSFDYIGLDSLARVNLLVGLEKECGVSLDPTAAYDFVTARALSEFVWSGGRGTPMGVKEVL